MSPVPVCQSSLSLSPSLSSPFEDRDSRIDLWRPQIGFTIYLRANVRAFGPPDDKVAAMETALRIVSLSSKLLIRHLPSLSIFPLPSKKEETRRLFCLPLYIYIYIYIYTFGANWKYCEQLAALAITRMEFVPRFKTVCVKQVGFMRGDWSGGKVFLP